MEQEFQKIVEKQKEIAEYSTIDYYSGNYREFHKLLDDKLQFSFFKKRNAKWVIEHLGEVLKYTNQSNMDWITYSILIKQKSFLGVLVANLQYFPYKEHLSELLLLFYHSYDKQDEVFIPSMIDILLDFHLNNYNYAALFHVMTKEQRRYFLATSIKKQVTISFSHFYMEDDMIAFILQNLMDIARYSTDILALKEFALRNNASVDELNDYIDTHLEQVVDSIIQSRIYNTPYYQDYKEFMCLLVKDILANENAKLSDIKAYPNGSFSTVFSIKDKVIKIGMTRETIWFPNNPYIIQPLVRETVKIGDKEMFLEVTERVDTNRSKISKEELYQLYKNIRNLGLIWTDVKANNVGRLLKDNVIHWREDIRPSNSTLSLQETRGEGIVLKAGDLVILDADFIYDENDQNIRYPCGLQKDFEKRYQDEKQMQEYILEPNPEKYMIIETDVEEGLKR